MWDEHSVCKREIDELKEELKEVYKTLEQQKEITVKEYTRATRYEQALKEIASEECQYTYCGAEYIAKQALEGK